MDNLKICRHSNGRGYCFLKEEYCVEGPCKDEKLVEYTPVVHGEWVQVCGSKKFICSVCGRKQASKLKELQIFCSHCGADMRKAVE